MVPQTTFNVSFESNTNEIEHLSLCLTIYIIPNIKDLIAWFYQKRKEGRERKGRKRKKKKKEYDIMFYKVPVTCLDNFIIYQMQSSTSNLHSHFSSHNNPEYRCTTVYLTHLLLFKISFISNFCHSGQCCQE